MIEELSLNGRSQTPSSQDVLVGCLNAVHAAVKQGHNG